MTTWDELKDVKQGDEVRVETSPGVFVSGFVTKKDDATRSLTLAAIGRAAPSESDSGSAVIERKVTFPEVEG